MSTGGSIMASSIGSSRGSTADRCPPPACSNSLSRCRNGNQWSCPRDMSGLSVGAEQARTVSGDRPSSRPAKDLIIIRGRNYAPQEMEELLLDVEGVRKGCAVAVSTMVEGEGEQLIILAEKDPRSKRPEKEVIAEINHCILTGLSLKPRDVELLESGTLPRTSSGKLRRSEALRQFLMGELVPPEKVNALTLLFEGGQSQMAWAKFRAEKK